MILGGIFVLFLLGSFISRMFFHKDADLQIESVIKREKPKEVIQLNILNSTKVSGIADKARTYMRNLGFDVVEIGNFTEYKKISIVIDRIGDRQSALLTAKAVGIGDSLVYTKIDSSLFLKCTIILGEDYKSLNAFR
jgi:hypothetical protein